MKTQEIIDEIDPTKAKCSGCGVVMDAEIANTVGDEKMCSDCFKEKLFGNMAKAVGIPKMYVAGE